MVEDPASPLERDCRQRARFHTQNLHPADRRIGERASEWPVELPGKRLIHFRRPPEQLLVKHAGRLVARYPLDVSHLAAARVPRT